MLNKAHLLFWKSPTENLLRTTETPFRHDAKKLHTDKRVSGKDSTNYSDGFSSKAGRVVGRYGANLIIYMQDQT